MVTPASTRGRASWSSANGWTSYPSPTRIWLTTSPLVVRNSPGRPSEGRPARSCSRHLEEGGRDHEVGGSGDLEVAGIARHHHHGPTELLDQGSVVGGLRGAGVRGAQRGGRERLRGLHRHETHPGDGGGDAH